MYFFNVFAPQFSLSARAWQPEDSSAEELVLWVDGLPPLDETERRRLPFALASFLNISPEKVHIKSISEGSIKINIELPVENAQELLDAYRRNDPEFIAYLHPLVILDLRKQPTRVRATAGGAHERRNPSHDELERRVRRILKKARDIKHGLATEDAATRSQTRRARSACSIAS